MGYFSAANGTWSLVRPLSGLGVGPYGEVGWRRNQEIVAAHYGVGGWRGTPDVPE